MLWCSMRLSIRTIFRPLLPELGMPETEFYELERAARAAGVFDLASTRWAKQENVLSTIILLMAGTEKRESARCVEEYRHLPLIGWERDYDLWSTITMMLLSIKLAGSITDMSLHHQQRMARVRFTDGTEHIYGKCADGVVSTTSICIANPFWVHLSQRVQELGIF